MINVVISVQYVNSLLRFVNRVSKLDKILVGMCMMSSLPDVVPTATKFPNPTSLDIRKVDGIFEKVLWLDK